MAATDRQETTTSVQAHGFELDRRTEPCLAGEEPSTEQGLRVSGANLRDDDRPCLNPPYAKPDRPRGRLLQHLLSSAANQALPVPADATDPQGAPQVVTKVEQRLGPITLL